MKYGTDGKLIEEVIRTCNCGLTSGCEYCNPHLRKMLPAKESFIGSITDEEAAEMIEKLNKWKERFNKDFSKRENW